MSILINPEKCMSVKNSKELNLQCPYKRKFGDYCGHHSNGKCKKRIDDGIITNENSDNLNIIESFEYFSTKNYSSTTLNVLKKTAKHLGLDLKTSKINKRILFDSIYDYYSSNEHYHKNIDKIIKIQAIYKGYYFRKTYGPGLINRKIINNEIDLLSCKKMDEIEKDFFISFKDIDNFVYGFDIRTLKKLLEYSNENPYNKKIISNEIIRIVNNRIELMKKKNININIKENKLTSKQEFRQKIIRIFQIIDELGNYSDPTWFLDLSLKDLKKYHYYIQDIWNWSFQASFEDKKRIFPPTGCPFVTNQGIVNNMKNKQDLFELIIKDINIIISEKFNEIERNTEDRKMGCWIVLSALVNVSDDAASALPHLYQQFENWNNF
tara:strand:+ start:3611 stop:4750 length:1140 start_codon:yes stop_codon:yes gene_type:complete